MALVTKRIGHHHAGHVLLQDAGHGPAVGGGLQGHLIGGPQHVLGEVRQFGTCQREGAGLSVGRLRRPRNRR